MQANWSLILNVLLLVGVVFAIGRLMKTRRQNFNAEQYRPSLGPVSNSPYDTQPFNDDIIAVRKINSDHSSAPVSDREKPAPLLNTSSSRESSVAQLNLQAASPGAAIDLQSSLEIPATAMMFLLAKDNRQFAGYELLQTVLAAGLRFGEGNLFHRHQLPSGQGPVIFSLAAATATGTFDLQNIGAFSVRGLCLYMEGSNNSNIDAERFAIMLDTGKQLSEGLDAYLLDDKRKPLTEKNVAHYYRLLQIDRAEHEIA